MRDAGLYRKYTMQQLLDKRDIIECFEDANRALRIGELLTKHSDIYEVLEVEAPTSSC